MRREILKVAGKKLVVYAYDEENDVYRPLRVTPDGKVKITL